MFAGINTFLKAPYAENIREVGRYDVAVVGAPFDMGTTYRRGARIVMDVLATLVDAGHLGRRRRSP